MTKQSIPRIIAEPAEHGFAESFDGVPIYWERHGPHPSKSKKTPMLFCYGLVCSVNQWRAQIERYSSERTCVLFDYRGHHLSGAPHDLSLLNLSALGKDAQAALKAAGVEKAAHVWGHSMGCNVAIELAAAYPEAVQTLNLCCGAVTNPFSSMLGGPWLGKLITPALDWLPKNPEAFYMAWSLLTRKPEISRWVVRIAGFNLQATPDQDVLVYAKAVANVEPRTFFALLRELVDEKSKSMAARVLTPTAIVAGAHDLVTPPQKQKEMGDYLQNSHYIEIPAGSHNVQLDFGEYVCLKIEDLWKKQGLWDKTRAK